MTSISPTAKALLEAYENSPFEYDTAELTWIAAVLRAAADLVVPVELHPESYKDCCQYSDVQTRAGIRAELLAIATELDISARD